MDVDFQRQSVVELAEAVRSGQVAARELAAHALARIESCNARLGAFVAVDGERAMQAASVVDESVAAGHDPGPLAGIPIGVKDLEDAAGFPTTHGSAALGPHTPATTDSVLVARLKAAGCVVVGKTNTPELGYKADTVNGLFSPTVNPWDVERSPGGSSGGTAAALAAGLVPLGTGSDGGGSIRIPAACCGLSGIKPSLGRVPTGGSEPPDWHDLSTRGPMARRVADVVAALAVVVGPDPCDLRSLPRPEASWPAALHEPVLPRRVGWSATLGYGEVDDEVRQACERGLALAAGPGVEVVAVDDVFGEDPLDTWFTLTAAYHLRSLAHVRDTDAWAKVDPLLAAQVDHAATLGALDMVRALDTCYRLNARLVELFHRIDVLVTPTTAGLAPRRALGGQGEVNGRVDPNWVRFTYPFNLTRSPAASVCVGRGASGMPIGMQVVGPQHADLVVIRSAAAVEAAVGFDEVAPGW